MADAYGWRLRRGEDRDAAARRFLARALERGAVDAVMCPVEDGSGAGVAYGLATRPRDLDAAVPLARAVPQFWPQNLVDLSEPGGGPMRVAAMLKPCEARAVVELAKLRQVELGGVTLVVPDCPGTVELKEYAHAGRARSLDVRPACRICRMPVAGPAADLAIGTFGVDEGELLLVPHSDDGAALARGAGAKAVPIPEGRMEAVRHALERGLAAYDRQEAESRERYGTHGPFLRVLATCIKCMNCMDVCPVCYCKECLFHTDAFNPTATSLADKARRRGVLRVPTETVQFHLTRMAHIMTACVMCGQCESACPSGIPLVEVYAGVNRRIQDLFGYEAGRSLEEAPPLTEFREDELE